MEYKYDLSMILPGNNEMYTSRTVQDILENKRGKTEIIVVLDGGIWANPPIPQHPDVNVIYIPNTIGQRSATKIGVRLSKAKYIAKADCHCSFDEGFDQKMLDAFKISGDNVTMVPVMRNLHVFDWKCLKCGSKWYQGPTPTRCMLQTEKAIIPNEKCSETKNFKRKMIWKPRRGTYSTSYAFDSQPHFQYFPEYKHRPEYIKDKAETGLTESMGLQGSFWMLTREKYFELNIDDERVGSWGNMGIDVACKTWLSGGRVLVNHRTWNSHLFRTQGGDFSFPYEHINNVDATKKRVWDFILQGKIPGQIHPVSWLVERFWPIPPGKPDDKYRNQGWSEDDLKKLKEKESIIRV